MANRRNEGGMPAEPRDDTRGMTDGPDYQTGEDVRGIGEGVGDEEFEDTEDLDESDEEDEDEEGSF